MSATTETRSADELAGARTRAVLGGLPVDLVEFDDALHEILNHPRSDDEATLAVVSVNLDHIHHFALADGDSARRPGRQPLIDSHDLRWLAVGWCASRQEAGRLTGRSWPRLAGSDVIEPILDAAEAKGLSVGFVGDRRRPTRC